MQNSHPTVQRSLVSHRRAGESAVATARARWLLIIFFVIIFLGALPDKLGGQLADDALSSQGSLYVQVTITLVFLGTVVTCFPRLVSFNQPVPLAILLMLLWCWLSLAWAPAPDIAVRRIAQLTMSTVIIFALVNTLGASASIRYLMNVLVAGLLLSVFAVALLPDGTRSDAEAVGAWSGIFVEKNAAGALTALMAILFIYRARLERANLSRQVMWAALAGLAVLFLRMSQSKTSFALVPVACFSGAMFALTARYKLLRAVWMALLLAAIISFLFRLEWWQTVFTEMMDDPSSLTGRVQIWGVLFEIIETQPWLGSGYGSFWSVGDAGPITAFAVGYHAWFTTVPHAHNGYIDIVLQCGFIGLAIAIIAAFIVPTRRLSRDRSRSAEFRWLYFSVLTFTIFHNFLESSLFVSRSPHWIVMITIIAAAYHRGSVPSAGRALSPHIIQRRPGGRQKLVHGRQRQS